jgi:hypothetical protein
MARRLTTILSAMTLAEALEATRLPRVASRPSDRTAFDAPVSRPASPALFGGTGAAAGRRVAGAPWRPFTESLDIPRLFSLTVPLDNKTRVEENGATPAAHW